jgi:hemolysin activation/secretion protein
VPLGQTGQEFYTGLDYGHVGGPSSDNLIGKNLAGAVMGLRGVLQGVQYEAFIATPVRKPVGFRTAGKTVGFNLNYSF